MVETVHCAQFCQRSFAPLYAKLLQLQGQHQQARNGRRRRRGRHRGIITGSQVKVLPQTQCCCCFYRFEMAKLEIVGLEPPLPPPHSDERGGENDEDRQLQRARSRRVLGVITQELEI